MIFPKIKKAFEKSEFFKNYHNITDVLSKYKIIKNKYKDAKNQLKFDLIDFIHEFIKYGVEDEYLEEYLLKLVDIYGFDEFYKYVENFDETTYNIISNFDTINLLIKKDDIDDEIYIYKHCTPEYFLLKKQRIDKKELKNNKKMSEFLNNLYDNKKILNHKIKIGSNIENYIKYEENKCDIFKYGNINYIKLLIKKGINFREGNHYFMRDLISFMDNKNTEIFNILVKNNIITKDDINELFLHFFRSSKYDEMLDFLLKNGADISILNTAETYEIIESQFMYKSIENFKMIIKNVHKIDINDENVITNARCNIEIFKYLDNIGVNIYINENSVFYDACLDGDLEIVKFFIKNGVSTDVKSDALISSCTQNDNRIIEIIKILIENGADIHAEEDQSFINACEYCNIEIIKLLIQYGANIHAQNDKALINACYYDDIETVKLLIENGANIHAQEDQAFINACYNNENIEIVKLLIEKGANIHAQENDALIKACSNSNIEIIKLLIENDANIHAREDRALINSCSGFNKKIEIVKYLIEKGANIHAREDQAFINACFRDENVEIVKYLIEKGANIHAQDDQALINACSINRNIEIVKFLIEKGANVHAQEDQALITACSSDRNIEIVKYLIEKGANVNAQDDQAIIKACSNHNFSIKLVKLLINNGANIHAQENLALINAYNLPNNFDHNRLIILFPEGVDVLETRETEPSS